VRVEIVVLTIDVSLPCIGGLVEEADEKKPQKITNENLKILTRFEMRMPDPHLVMQNGREKQQKMMK